MIRTNFSRYEFPELIDQRGYKSAVEVGVNLGQFSYHLLKYSQLTVLVGVDSYKRRFAHYMKGAVSLLEPYTAINRYKLHRMGSVDAANMLSKDGRLYDFIYIDADHSKAAVAADIAAWYPLVRPGGILAGHDYVDVVHQEVQEAVNEFAEASGLQLHVTREAWGSWFFEIPQ